VTIDVDDAVEHVVRRYLGGFGPAPVGDIANWAGLAPKQVAATLDRMGSQLRQYRAESGADLVDLRGAKLPPEDAEVPVRFLPVWDAMLLVHARRTGILPEEYRAQLFSSKNPQSFPTFLVDGRVAGTWKHTPAGVVLSPFIELSASARSALENEAVGLDLVHLSG
jgi:hypothetical protein